MTTPEPDASSESTPITIWVEPPVWTKFTLVAAADNPRIGRGPPGAKTLASARVVHERGEDWKGILDSARTEARRLVDVFISASTYEHMTKSHPKADALSLPIADYLPGAELIGVGEFDIAVSTKDFRVGEITFLQAVPDFTPRLQRAAREVGADAVIVQLGNRNWGLFELLRRKH